jgi:hypothetical protein
MQIGNVVRRCHEIVGQNRCSAGVIVRIPDGLAVIGGNHHFDNRGKDSRRAEPQSGPDVKVQAIFGCVPMHPEEITDRLFRRTRAMGQQADKSLVHGPRPADVHQRDPIMIKRALFLQVSQGQGESSLTMAGEIIGGVGVLGQKFEQVSPDARTERYVPGWPGVAEDS